LYYATENRTFLRAFRLPADAARLEPFRADMVRLANCRPIGGADEASQALQWTIEAAGRDVGLDGPVVAIEFVFAATESLDRYSGFVPRMDKSAPSVELEDHIVGVGVEIKCDEQESGMLIVHALAGGPAAEAGLKAGDVIESVDGRSLAEATLESAVDAITGPPRSRVTLGVRRNGRTSEVTLVRRRVEVHSLSEVQMLADGVGYIKLDKFAQNSSDEMDQALWSLHRQGMKSLIVDVRGNPGGLLTTAVDVSNKFLPCGTIVSTRGRDASDNSTESARYEQTWKVPLVVLVDEHSASASEIFAAAVQENGRGLVVGRRTYGKGSVQTHFPMRTVAGNLRLTTAAFFSPKGRPMAGAGVEPDVRVAGGRRPERTSFEHEVSYRHEGPQASDRDLAAATEVARSKALSELAQSSADNCRRRTYQGLSNRN
jgi:carboxyl-terminal processing protease